MIVKDEKKENLIDELVDVCQRITELETPRAEVVASGKTFDRSLEKIEAAKQEWESTVDSLANLVCLLDEEGRVTRANKTIENWNLAQVTDVKGTDIHQLLHPNCSDDACYMTSTWPQLWQELLKGKPGEFEVEDKILRRHLRIQVRPTLIKKLKTAETQLALSLPSSTIYRHKRRLRRFW